MVPGHPRGRQRPAAAAPPGHRFRLPRAQHECVPRAPRPHVSGLSRRWHVHHGHLRQVGTQGHRRVESPSALSGLCAHGAAAVQQGHPDRHRRIDHGRRHGLAEAHVGRRCAQGGQPGSDRHAADAAARRLPQSRRPVRRAQSAREPSGPVLPVRRPDLRDLLQRRRAGVRPEGPAAAKGSGVLRAAEAGQFSGRDGPDQ